jgi:hypothetical protein
MTRLFFLTLVLSGLSVLNSAHEYYVSLTEITFNPEKNRVEIISRLFHDDFEKVLKTRYSENLELKPSIQSENIEDYIKLYFDKKLQVLIDNSHTKAEYLGYKFEQDRINIFLKIDRIENVEVIKVQNLLLTDVFEDQKNIVHGFKLNQKKSVLLTRFDSEAMLKFN